MRIFCRLPGISTLFFGGRGCAYIMAYTGKDFLKKRQKAGATVRFAGCEKSGLWRQRVPVHLQKIRNFLLQTRIPEFFIVFFGVELLNFEKWPFFGKKNTLEKSLAKKYEIRIPFHPNQALTLNTHTHTTHNAYLPPEE